MSGSMPESRRIHRTMRVDSSLWEQGKARAEREGTTISTVARQLIEGYAQGYYDPPTETVVRTYPRKKEAS